MPGEERFLVTGALGCIGAWTVGLLHRDGVPALGFDLGSNRSRVELVLGDEAAGVPLVHGDITDVEALERTLDEHGITHVVHLAALLIPLIKRDPPHGALVNVVGTANVLEAARRRGLRGVSYASSIAAYGPADAPLSPVPHDAVGHPVSYYGVHKQACEGLARIYSQDEGVASVGLRPHTVYGPGRDTGLTAEPTLAMAAAARGEGYHMSFGGRLHMQFAPDVAAAFIAAARAATEGARVYNLAGSVVHMSEVVSTIEDAAPAARGRITFDDVQLPFPEEFDARGLEELGELCWTPLADGVRETIERLRAPAQV